MRILECKGGLVECSQKEGHRSHEDDGGGSKMAEVGCQIYGRERIPGIVGWQRPRKGEDKLGDTEEVFTLTGGPTNLDGSHPVGDGEKGLRGGQSGH